MLHDNSFPNELSDAGKLLWVGALASEVIKYGEAEAMLIDAINLSDSQSDAIVKANAMLCSYALTLTHIQETKNVALANVVIEMWNSNMMQEVIAYAFEEEITDAKEKMAESINAIEALINQQTS